MSPHHYASERRESSRQKTSVKSVKSVRDRLSVRGRMCDWVGILVVFHICDADFYLDFGRFIFVMGWWKIMGVDNQIDMIFYNF